MLLTKTQRHVGIGLIVMGLALVTFAYPDQLQTFLNIVQGLQLTATASLFYGIFKKDPLHKDKFLFFWLVSTAFFCFTLVFCSFNCIGDSFFDFDVFSGILILLAQWIASAAVAFFLYLMYQEYVELIQNNRVAGLSLPGAYVFNPTVETKQNPPPYIAPTSENMTVSIQS